MLRRSLLAGFLLILLLPTEADAASKTLYQRLLEQVEREQAEGTADDDVALFIRLIVKDRWDDMTDKDIKDVMTGSGLSVCGGKPNAHKLRLQHECSNMMQTVQKIAVDQQRIRLLGRNLQSIATSFELPLSDLPDRALHLSSDLQGILSIWSAGTGSVKSDTGNPPIRTIAVDGEAYRPRLQKVGDALKKLRTEEQIGAVWRYRSGVRLVQNRRSPRFPPPVVPFRISPGEELQYLGERWGDVETALAELFNAVRAYDTPKAHPLSSQETAYVVFPKKIMEETLPDNVIVWTRLDGDDANTGFATDNSLFGDAGLDWQIPLEPLMPSLFYKENDETLPIKGGNYPPEYTVTDGPLDGMLLCTSPLALRGYLCRPFESASQEKGCPAAPNPSENEITLVHCIGTGATTSRFTAASADVCREIDWKVSKPFDPQTQCTVKLGCASMGCPVQGNATATTYDKNSNGEITACFRNTSSDIQMTYLVFHELVHVNQRCAAPPGTVNYEKEPPGATLQQRNDIKARNTGICCRLEGEAYHAQCAMMERDGVFDGMSPVDGIAFNAETCAEMWTDFSCGPRDGFNGCFTSRTYTPAFIHAMGKEASGNNPKNLPVTCKDALDPAKMDPRVKALKEHAEKFSQVCTPATVTDYKNRIGNNLCFIGQCVEQSTELHRLTAGRSTAGVGDPVAPWQEPATGTPLGTILTNPSLSTYQFPPYRPQLLARTLDQALCQSVGLPAMMPPTLCAVEANRQLELSRTSGVEMAMGLLGQTLEQQKNLRDLTELSRGIGIRTGTELYADYLNTSSKSFADIIRMANTLLSDLKNISFPTQMCPVSPGLPSPLPSPATP